MTGGGGPESRGRRNEWLVVGAERKELLGPNAPARGPKSRTATTGKDHCMTHDGMVPAPPTDRKSAWGLRSVQSPSWLVKSPPIFAHESRNRLHDAIGALHVKGEILVGPAVALCARMLKRALPFALLAACTTEGLSTTGQDIIGGTTAQITDFPSVVGLEETPGMWFCTGTLIDPQWVLTAAHCMDGETATKIHVRFGSNNIETATTGTVVGVAEIHSHPGFDGSAWDNDIALIKLAAPVTNVTPSPILRDTLAIGSQVVDVGYGVSDNNDGGGGILRKVSKVTADCAGANDPGISGANLICMNAADGKGSCFGDSGGPTFAMINNQRVVAGVTSGGSGDQCGAGWDLYTSVKAEIDFVDATMTGVTPPSDPTDPGMGSGSNTDTGTGSGDGNHDMAGGDDRGGCNAGGSAGSFVLLALICLVRRKREAKPAE